MESCEDGEDMEIDANDTVNEEKNCEYEDMDIDSPENEDKKRSRLMEKRIKDKAKKVEEKEKILENRRKVKEIEKKKREEIKVEKIKQSNKHLKQKAKDERKKSSKKNSSKNTDEIFPNKVPNIKPVPKNCIHLLKKGDKGDGACGPNSASAFLFEDEVFGTKLKQKMNRFMAKHWNKKYRFKTQCSKDDPFVRKLGGGGEVSFTDPEKLIDYLENSEEAVYMWTDSEDLAVVSDMYQVKIKIITTEGENDKNPTVNWISPDKELKEQAGLSRATIEISSRISYVYSL